MLPFLLERILDEMPAWLYNNNMIKFLIPTAKEMKPSKEVPSQKLSKKSEAILTEMAKLSTDDLSIAYKIKPEQAEKEKQRWDAILAGEAKNYPAVELFNGLMYRFTLNARTYPHVKKISSVTKYLSHLLFMGLFPLSIRFKNIVMTFIQRLRLMVSP